MARVILHPKVPDDLLDTMNYLKGHNPAAADRFADGAAEAMGRLSDMPGMGSLKAFRDKRLSGIRSWPVSGFPNHLIYYRPIDVGVRVLAVLHGARRVTSVLCGRQ